jgi:hypothetical protein
MKRKQLREMKRMIEYIKTIKELQELLGDFNPAGLTESMGKVVELAKKYAPVKG